MRTQWAFEVPFDHLEDFAPYQDFHMVLSSQWWKAFEYRYFYRDVYVKGLKSIWLDNGWNEQGYADDFKTLKMIDIDIHPAKIILPDVFPRQSRPLLKLLQEAERNEISWERAVPVLDHWRVLRTVGAQVFTVAIPYRQRRHMTDAHLQFFKGTHFLGCNSTDEIKIFKPLSCDTSMPIKLAILHMTWDQWKKQNWPHTHTSDMEGYFTKKMTRDEIELAIYNIVKFKEESGCGAM